MSTRPPPPPVPSAGICYPRRPPPPPVPSAGICVGCRSSDVPCKCNHSAEGAIVVLLIIGVAVGLFLLGFAARGAL